MQEWILQVLETPTLDITVLLAAFLLGMVGAVGSCCGLPVLAAIAGYSGAEGGGQNRRSILLSGGFFMIGTIAALAGLGAITGFVSQTIGTAMGVYWKVFAGLVMIFFGVVSLDLVPFALPSFGSGVALQSSAGPTKAIVYGLALGGGTTACSVGCNPVLPVVLGVVTLQGQTWWGALLLGAFAIGYSLPLAAGLVGLGYGFGKLTSVLQRFAPAIKYGAGVLLIGVGFYLLLWA
ncbi:MAG: hypothetical protein OEV49_02970 [candidate division Zixibacteria bacterium]|nr:hypothetical protein [candidate division Zixibacteria bacterium]MDH3938133.1 hypothetical protein [candidate division Zixibacteria bacterium]MDH4033558.1 hypothetical protein [candidate division Zixibacteria bacterium]